MSSTHKQQIGISLFNIGHLKVIKYFEGIKTFFINNFLDTKEVGQSPCKFIEKIDSWK